jgi:hypothetical protein
MMVMFVTDDSMHAVGLIPLIFTGIANGDCTFWRYKNSTITLQRYIVRGLQPLFLLTANTL